MARENPRSTARIAKHPIHPILVPFPIVCFVGTLLTDLTYWRTAEMMWADFSAWLVTVGVVMGWLAAIAGLIDFSQQPASARPSSSMASCDRQCRGANIGHVEHVRAQP